MRHDPRRLTPLDGAVIGVMIAALILLAVRSSPDSEPAEAATPASTTTTTAVAPTTAAPTTTTPAPTTTTAAPPATPAPELAALRINDQPATTAGYSRDLFPTWLDFDGNGCDARDDTLTVESLTVVTRAGCDVTGGQWLSIYDEVTVTVPGALDIDHLVPLAEAWRSGAHAWDAERRARFANDLGYDDHLIAVTASSNRSKGDRPPNEWRPPSEASWCRYATAWVHVKVTWDLSATTPERDALGQMLERC